MGTLEDHDIALVRAENPGPFTLTGTNTWVVGREPCWIVDPGPEQASHQEAVAAVARERGGVGGIALTHDHADHVGGHAALMDRLRGDGEVPLVGAARFPADVALADGAAFGPLTAVASPGHAPDHLAFVTDDGVLFSGDAVLGTGSVFVAPSPGALTGYLAALRGLRARDLVLICPGHGPLVDDPHAKLDEYLEHRLERERKLVAALAAGGRTIEGLLDAAWGDAPAELRPAAAITMAAHLDKLEEEGRLPGGVERPEVPTWLHGAI
ncbi:MBL fold metallo-hydrolase [Conexibacter sp. W3-3-2]|uniref:MBL fold metallo-hydrolase n=1 Tax=Conexibacter sp. W3-3-2 TaxID=2675227 RepID=UPI0012B94A9F|nr:MBL fold metallo-hydrolase [Conexibacter sp. W3-3-2]MTD44232.1 MBL fold metallo-hydrolase [Conexibacter sp. W3-3-2]